MKLFNLNDCHISAVSEIDAITLLHFMADVVRDWECHGGCENNEECPFLWECVHMPEGVLRRVCLLESIKDNAYCLLEKPPEEDEEE